jgi:hypothetical protein
VGKKSVERNARLEALRREQKRKERRRALLVYGSAGFVALALLAGIVTYTIVDNRSKNAVRKVGYAAEATEAAGAAGCTGVVNDPMRGRNHVGPTAKVDYEVAPPSSGNHDSNPLPDVYRFYEPTSGVRAERAVHNLEHGFVVAWYDRDLPKAQVDALRKVAGGAGERFIAVPWTREAFPSGQHFVLTAWDRTQRCRTVSEAAVKEFTAAYANPDPEGATWESPTAPESGAPGGNLDITPDGPLPPGATPTPGAGTMGGPAGAGTASPGSSGSPAPPAANR